MNYIDAYSHKDMDKNESEVILDIILKYQNKRISLMKLGESISQYFFSVIKLRRLKKEAVIICIQNILKIYRLSFFRGMLCSLLIIYFSVIRLLKFISRRFIFVMKLLLEYIEFFILFRQRCSRLKTSKKKKNILCIVRFMAIGGAEIAVLNIAKGINKGKFNFHIITTTPSSNAWTNRFQSHFQNIIIPVKKVVSENICNQYFRKIIKKLNIDIVLISNSLIGYKYLPQLKSEFEYVKTMDLLHVEESVGAIDGLEWVTPYLDQRICISNHLKEYMIQKYINSGFEDRYIKRLKIIRNGIDMREYSLNVGMKGRFRLRFGVSDNVRTISFIGRFSEEKDPLLFVDIARYVIARLPNYKLKFIMAGDGPQFEIVKNTIDKYGIKDYFILTGVIDNITELLADTHILLVVSKNEGMPFVIIEALAVKVPVISTDVGAINEVVKDGINGYLINPEHNVVEEFTSKILDLLSGQKKHQALVEKTRKTIISEYSLETMGTKYKNIFDKLLGKD